MVFRQFVIPGFVDTHLHAPQYPNCGKGLDKPLLEWLEAYTFPTEAKFKDLQYAADAYKKVVVSTRSVKRLKMFFPLDFIFAQK